MSKTSNAIPYLQCDMANTYTQIHIHIVCVVKRRANLIQPANRETLHKYISGIVKNKGHKLLQIFCMPDHMHILLGFKPITSISDLIRDIKANSSRFINEEKWCRVRFEWQKGYGAFSHSMSEISRVITYIQNQETHHGKKSFREEYTELLAEHKIEFENKYLFDFEPSDNTQR